MGTRWTQAKYLDHNGKGMKAMPYTITHACGKQVKGTLDQEGKTKKFEGLPEGTATYVFGDIKKLEKQKHTVINDIEKQLERILKVTKTQAKQQAEKLAKESAWDRYWSGVANRAGGIADGVWSDIKGIGQTIKMAVTVVNKIAALERKGIEYSIDAISGHYAKV